MSIYIQQFPPSAEWEEITKALDEIPAVYHPVITF